MILKDAHEPLAAYVRDLYAAEDEHLQTIRAQISDRGFPPAYIKPEEGVMLQFLLKSNGARRVVEVGTLGGYSGLWIVRALPEDGRLITLERDEERAVFAGENFARAGVGDRVEVRVGDAAESLAALADEGPFDAVFIDADKAAYPVYLDWALENIRSGGLILAHNAFASGEVVGISDRRRDPPDLNGIQTFNRRLAGEPRLLGTIIPVGDGIAAAVVK